MSPEASQQNILFIVFGGQLKPLPEQWWYQNESTHGPKEPGTKVSGKGNHLYLKNMSDFTGKHGSLRWLWKRTRTYTLLLRFHLYSWKPQWCEPLTEIQPGFSPCGDSYDEISTRSFPKHFYGINVPKVEKRYWREKTFQAFLL